MRFILILILALTTTAMADAAHQQALQRQSRYETEHSQLLSNTEQQVDKANMTRQLNQQDVKSRNAQPILRRELRQQRPRRPK